MNFIVGSPSLDEFGLASRDREKSSMVQLVDSDIKTREVLGWNPRSREEAILATAESLLKVGA